MPRGSKETQSTTKKRSAGAIQGALSKSKSNKKSAKGAWASASKAVGGAKKKKSISAKRRSTVH